MEESLLGVFKMVEERFGRAGRPITTGLLVLVALGAAAWMTGLIWEHWGKPLADLAKRVLEGGDVIPPVATLSASLITVLTILAVLWLLWRFLFRGKWEGLNLRLIATGRVLMKIREQSERMTLDLKVLEERTKILGTTDQTHIDNLKDIYGHLQTLNNQMGNVLDLIESIQKRIPPA